MTTGILAVATLILAAALPVLIDRYLRGLPIAPVCPACRAVARPTGMRSEALAWLPAFARTFIAECERCGWHGRMRWRLAPQRLRRSLR